MHTPSEAQHSPPSAPVERRQGDRRTGDRRLEDWTAAARLLREDRRVGDRRLGAQRRRPPPAIKPEPRVRYGHSLNWRRGLRVVVMVVVTAGLTVHLVRRASATQLPGPAGLEWAELAPVKLAQPLASSTGVDASVEASAATSADTSVPAVATNRPTVPAPTEAVAQGVVEAASEATTSAAVTHSNTSPRSAPPRSVVASNEVATVGLASRYSVTLGSYSNLANANARMAELTERDSEHLYVLAPVEVGGTIFHRLLGGAASDQAGASKLTASLAAAIGESSDSWIVRETPLAFELARSPLAALAESLRAEMDGLSVPSYVLRATLGDGSTEYRVYVGAYADADEARPMRRMLEERGFADLDLVERVGRPG